MIFVYLSVLLPIVGGLGLLFIRSLSHHARKIAYSILLFVSAGLVWAALLTAGDSVIPLVRFSETLVLAFRLDGASRLFSGLCAALWPVVTVYACGYMRHDVHLPTFWAFFAAVFGVTMGIAYAANMLTMYLFYLLLIPASVPLIMLFLTPRAIQAAIKYAVMTLSGTIVALSGVVYLMLHGAQDFTYGGHITAVDTFGLVVFTVSFVGFAISTAVWPFHDWLPSTSAPSPVTALLHAAVIVNAGAFACIRLTHYTFSAEALQGTWAQYAVMALAVITLLYGSATAWRQRHFKRRLSFSTVSNLSYILFGVSLMTRAGLIAALLHLLMHSVMKMLAYLCSGLVLHATHREQINELEGLGKHMPVTFFCFTVAACALTGVPPLNGFVSKWYLGFSAVQSGDVAALCGFGAILISSLVTAIYMFEPVIKVYFPSPHAPEIPEETVHQPSRRMLGTVVFLALACIVMGLFPQVFLDLVGKAVM